MAERAQDASLYLPAVRAGSSDAMGKMLEACRGYLLTIAGKELDADLRAKGGASDLVQETFLKAQRHFDAFAGDTEAELLAWLRRLLLNNLADFTRQYRVAGKRQVSREIALRGGDSSEAGTVEPSADTETPSGEAVANEQAAAVAQAMARLPEDYRRVLALRYEDGKSFEEIGALMERSGNAIRKLWLRAVERLQQELDNSHESR
jgi:RNA polymerase sigma-70 factor (ECF subfamily)